ncbi:MAG: hypothetical protein GY754_35465 [bacterium]|nr:hypothetical protein [bacterium]
MKQIKIENLSVESQELNTNEAANIYGGGFSWNEAKGALLGYFSAAAVTTIGVVGGTIFFPLFPIAQAGMAVGVAMGGWQTVQTTQQLIEDIKD